MFKGGGNGDWVGCMRRQESVEHGLDLVVEGLVVEVVDLYGLEVFLGVEIALGDEECLSEHQLLPKINSTLILASS